MSTIDHILEVPAFAAWLGLQTEAAKGALAQQLQTWQHDTARLQHMRDKCQRFQAAFEKDPAFFEKCHALFGRLTEMETRMNGILGKDSELESESYGEILFLKPFFHTFNFLPGVLSLWAILRMYVLPGLSLLIPILTLIAPYVILHTVFHVPITFTNYMTILHSMMSGTFDALDEHALNESQGFTIAAIFKQVAVALVTILQGIIQPYWSYQHLQSIDTIIQGHGALLLNFRDTYEELSQLLESHGFTMIRCPLPAMETTRDATARAILESAYFKLALRYVGSVEVAVCLAHHPDICPVRWVSSPTPVFRCKDAFDFHVDTAVATRLSVDLSVRRHALLTGPNKGGKSTVLRALSVNALLAHTYGCAIGSMTLTPFSHLYVCLKPDDLPGTASRFEREIQFTASTLQHRTRVLVLIDELYHSTNPPDALRSCHLYSQSLWNRPNMVSVISTHLFEWVEQAPSTIQRLCCPATMGEDGGVTFLYTLEEGVCKVSSVDTLLRRNGLAVPAC